MFGLGGKRVVGVVLVLVSCLAPWSCTKAARGVSVELTATAPGIEQVRFTVGNSTIAAETLVQGVQPGPHVVVYPTEGYLLLEGRWRQAGEEKTWRSQVPWTRGEALVLELGSAPEGVRLIRTAH